MPVINMCARKSRGKHSMYLRAGELQYMDWKVQGDNLRMVAADGLDVALCKMSVGFFLKSI
jgi:hypothetical protein